jgi:hypothetical protein
MCLVYLHAEQVLEEGISVQQAEQGTQHQQQVAPPSSSSSSNQSIIGAYRVSITFRLLPNPTRHGPPSHASDPYCDVMNAS